jgi:uncharacterized protein YyaL (SSP411 family)
MKFNSIKLGLIIYVFFMSAACKNTNNSKEQGNANHLIHETSAYLLEHAHNPVDWYPWGDEALNKAKNESKLLVISIGYSSCHWCHVMERESFSDTAVSRLMNKYFISIKVDREERPDIDNVYMTACQISNPNGSCGWPLNAITLPDGKPVWVGSYLPRNDWMKLLNQVNELYHEDQNELQKMAYQIANHLQTDHRFSLSSDQVSFQENTIKSLHKNISANLDYSLGGRAGQLKFPMPTLIQYAMEYTNYSPDPKTEAWIKTTLDEMMNGGIYDQLSGGFARYSTDPQWRVPHFEKMLYDNAQLISVYANAYKRSKSEAYKRVLQQTISFMQTDFSNEQGCYFSSFDADSEGEEGKYYAWTQQEIKQILADDKSSAIISELYNITPSGNWERGQNVLSIENSNAAIAKKFGISEIELQSFIQNSNEKLLKARKARVSPRRDEKIISAWNAMMVCGLSDAYAALGDEKILQQAIKTGNFLKNEMLAPDHRMYRTYKAGKKGEFAFLDDYAFTIQCFVKLYEATFDESWLLTAKSLCDYVIKNFSDEEKIYFYYNSSLDPALIARKKEMDDQVIPATNSVMCDALHKLGLYLYNTEYIQRSQNMLLDIVANPAAAYPVFHSNWLRIYIEFLKPLYEVAIVGPEYKNLQKELLSRYLPQSILLGGANEGSLELLKEKLQEGQTYIYVCRNKVCKLPVKEAAKAIELMK